MAVPFHEACFNILANSVGLEKGIEIDKDVMWEAMIAQLAYERPVLDAVDYKLQIVQGQFWRNNPGEEYSVCDPSPRPALRETIPDMLPACILGRALEVDLSNKLRSDPSHALPYDILLEILGYMNTEDRLSFTKASYRVNSSTREAAFWKHMIRTRILPWFDELRHFLETTSTDALDYKGLFFWADALTRAELGNQGPLMYIANRRRIWECCQPLATLYKRMVGPVEPAEPENSEEAKAILESSVCLHMPMTMYPAPRDPETISVQFIHARNETKHRSCVLDTYWKDNGIHYGVFLTSISITLGGQRRLFGSAEGELGHPLHIESGEWIQHIICITDEIDMLNSNQDRSAYQGPEDAKSFTTAFVKNLQIKVTTGKDKFVTNDHRSDIQKPFLVLDGMHLVGLTGQIAPNGAISRLGLLQASKPDLATAPLLQYDPAQQLSWKSNANYLPYKQSLHPICSHPSYHYDLFPVSTYISRLDPPEEMMMHNIFPWPNTCVEVFQPVGATIRPVSNRTSDGELVKESVPSTNAKITARSTPDSFPGTETSSAQKPSSSYQISPGPDIVGIFTRSELDYSGRGRGVGREEPVPAQHPRWSFGVMPLQEALLEMWEELHKHSRQNPEQQMGAFGSTELNDTIVFPLNGESITEVHVEQQYRALKLVTQSGRVGYFSRPHMNDWWVRRAVKEERFVGISACFGSLGGWSGTAMMWSHWKLSRVEVIFEMVDGEGKLISKEQEVLKGKNGKEEVFKEGTIEAVTGYR